MIRPASFGVALLAVGAALRAPELAAQDVEILGRIYGTRPPAAYYETKAADPRAFEMTHGLAAARSPAGGGGALRAGGVPAALTLGRKVTGTYRFPVVLGLFSDSPAGPFAAGTVQAHFFDGPNPTGTIPDLYAEMSGGLVRLRGDVYEWTRSRFTRAQATGGVSGLSSGSQLGRFILDVLSQLQGIDWGAYDNDGPDGVPNSGDDDGYVDVLAVVHPTPGAECGGAEGPNRVWSHKWTLRAAAGQDFVTSTPSRRGGFIRVSDYTIQPAYACNGTGINEIGVFAHELGHGFGLPDLYGTGDTDQAGAGRWDLMGTGAWGCGAIFEPERPCHMGAWSKAALGWVDVEPVPFGTDGGRLTLGPVETDRKVLAIPSGDGSGEYYLLENRQKLGFDAHLSASGLLIWQIDPAWVASRLAANIVNSTPSHLGVWLRQADGLNQLARTASQQGNRGDAGDPFPGAGGATAFHAGTNPSSFTNASVATGVTLTDIAEQGMQISFREVARYQSLRIRTGGDVGAAASGPLFTVDGAPVGGSQITVRSAPYQRHTIEAIAGAPLADGVRRGFAGWRDAPQAGRLRVWTTGLEDVDLEALYGGPREMRLAVTYEGGRFDVAPGRIVPTPASPDLWFPEGTTVALQAQSTTGFAFRSWGGGLAGQPNPAVVLMDQPRDATAAFDFLFAIEPNQGISLPAATPGQIALPLRNGNLPATWTLIRGAIPEGMSFSRSGLLTGEALVTGTFPIDVSVTDALGLQATGTFTVNVTTPVIPTSVLTAAVIHRGGDALTSAQRRFLDRSGNNDGGFDLGDFRAYVLANPNAPATAQAWTTTVRSGR